MKIPMGNFGNSVVDPARAADLGPAPTATARAIQGLGDMGMRIAAQKGEEKRNEAEALARAKAANALLDFEIHAKTAETDLSGKVSRGEVPYESAGDALNEAFDAYEMPEIEGLDEVSTENLNRGVQRLRFATSTDLGRSVETARRNDYGSQVATSMAKLSQLAGMPGADVEKINERAVSLAPLARQAGVSEAKLTEMYEKFKEDNWYNQATQRGILARENPELLAQLEQDVTSGYYVDKIGVDKRNTLLREVMGNRIRHENRAQHEIERRDAKADRTLTKIEQQVASGVPATAEMWATWQAEVQGTPAEGSFGRLMNSETEVQQVLQQPIGEQQAFIQRREQELSSKGGTMADQANLTRLRNAVATNVKLLEDEPLRFYERRTGQVVQPLDFASMAQGGTEKIAGQLQDRMNTLAGMQKQYGNVRLKPLLGYEAEQLTRILQDATPQDQAGMFGLLRAASGDIGIYQRVVEQIAPQAPVKALAGLLMFQGDAQATVVEAGYWYGDAQTVSGKQVAETLLAGEALLAQQGKEGQSKPFTMPEAADFQKEFDKKAEGIFAGNPAAYAVAEQAVRAYYVGASAQRGTTSTKLGTTLLNEAFKAVVGTPIEYNGGHVVPPWGMPGAAFTEAMKGRVAQTLGTAGYDRVRTEALVRRATPRNLGDGTYRLVFDGEFVTDPKTGKDLVIDLKRGPTPAPSAPVAPKPPAKPKAIPQSGASLEQIPAAKRRELAYNASELNDYASSVEQKYDLPEGLINALKNAGEKSGSRAKSNKGAQGVMQFMPENLKKYGVKDATDPLELIDAAGRYLADTMKQYGGNVEAVIADYNGGPRQARMVMQGKKPRAAETQKYLERVRLWLAQQDKVKQGPGGVRG